MHMDDVRSICPAAQCHHTRVSLGTLVGFFSVSKGVPAQPQVGDITSTLVGVMQSECKSVGAGDAWCLYAHRSNLDVDLCISVQIKMV